MARRTAIVVTTVFEPAFLAGYLRSVRGAGRQNAVTFYLIIDRKTPESVAAAADAARNDGFDVRCPTLDEQVAFLSALGAPDDFIPWNTDNRRNVGFLMALRDGADVLISIDDDNYCAPDVDFVGEHHVVGSPCDAPAVSSSDGWFNICDLLDGWPAGEVFPRGFPYAAQRAARTLVEREPADSGPVAINAGLWVEDPDVDAISRLSRRPCATAFSGRSIVLDADTWSPINTQNTALTRDAAQCYYYVRMGYPLSGLRIDRFGDILSGYLTQKVVKHLAWSIRAGSPVLTHRRTPHNLFKDLYHELGGIVLIEDFVPWLRGVELSGGDPLTAYESLADEIAAAAHGFHGFIWDEGGRGFLEQTARLMIEWTTVVRRLGANA